MYALIASPFLDDYLIVKPGSTAGIKISHQQYRQLQQPRSGDSPAPQWLRDAVRQRWEINLPQEQKLSEYLLVRGAVEPQYSRASWEINLGCNYDCEHCYLGLKQFDGLTWPDKERLLHVMRDAGVLWLQITGGEPTVDPLFIASYTLAWELGMMITVSTNGSRLWKPEILDMLTRMPAYRVVVSMYGATAASYDGSSKLIGIEASAVSAGGCAACS